MKEILNVEYGAFSFDLDRIIKLVKADLKDDWFLDPLYFEDRLSKEAVVKYFNENIQSNDGLFKPLKSIELNIPKTNNTLRYTLETCIYDRIAYHAFGETLIRLLDNLISRRVFNHRFDLGLLKGGKNIFLNAIEQWKKFENFSRIGNNKKTIVKTDLQNYYENINVDRLEATLLVLLRKLNADGTEKAKIRFCITEVCRCLRNWSYNGQHGIPQNRDISSFLANVYMYPVDSVMIDQGFDYYRYMDDITIISKDVYKARKSLKLLITELRKLGLSVNTAKTSILLPKTKEHEAFFLDDDFELEQIHSLISSRKKPQVAIGFQKVRDNLLSLVSDGEIDSRKFRFYINKISRISRCKDVIKPQGFFSPINELIIAYLEKHPISSDQYIKYLSSVELTHSQVTKIANFLCDENKAIYGWQNYLIWKLLILKEYDSQKVKKYAFSIIKKSKSVSDISGSLLYIGKFGTESQRKHIVKLFHKMNNFFLLRHALIAIQEVKWKEIKGKIEIFITEESKGVFRSLSNSSSHKYAEQPEEIKYSDLINEVSFYE